MYVHTIHLMCFITYYIILPQPFDIIIYIGYLNITGSSTGSNNNTGAVIGGVVGGIIVAIIIIIIIIMLVWCCMKHREKSSRPSKQYMYTLLHCLHVYTGYLYVPSIN